MHVHSVLASYSGRSLKNGLAETLSSLKEWLKQLPSYGMEAVECGSLTLDGPQIAAIEEAVLNMEVGATCRGLSKHATYIASFH